LLAVMMIMLLLIGLIPSLATKEELNEWERENNLQARA